MKVLVVEDEPDTLHEIMDCLKYYDNSIEAEGCCSPLLAMNISRRIKFDVALLDIRMPEMNGLELAGYLVESSPDIRVIFLTAYNCYATEAFELCAIDYVLKPIRQERFNKAMDKVKRILEENQKKTQTTVYSGIVIQAFEKLMVSSELGLLKWKRRKSSEVFAYLLHQHGLPVHKEKLCEIIWPEQNLQKALTYLQTIMYQLRKNLADIVKSGIVIEYADHCYRLNITGVQYDVDLFLDSWAQTFKEDSPSLEDLIRTEKLYKGAYLEEEGWIWALGRQHTIARKYQKVLESIIKLKMHEENKEDALYYIQKWAALDVFNNQNFYLTWVEENIGLKAAEQLKSLFSGD